MGFIQCRNLKSNAPGRKQKQRVYLSWFKCWPMQYVHMHTFQFYFCGWVAHNSKRKKKFKLIFFTMNSFLICSPKKWWQRTPSNRSHCKCRVVSFHAFHLISFGNTQTIISRNCLLQCWISTFSLPCHEANGS